MSSSVWQLDRARNLYYRVDNIRHQYIYQNGLTIAYVPETSAPVENEEEEEEEDDDAPEEDDATEEGLAGISSREVSHDRDTSDGSNFSFLSKVSSLSISATDQNYGSPAAGTPTAPEQSISNETQAASRLSSQETSIAPAYQSRSHSYGSAQPGPAASNSPYSAYPGPLSYSMNAATSSGLYSTGSYQQHGYPSQGAYTANGPAQQFGGPSLISGHNYSYAPNAGRAGMPYGHNQGSGRPTGFTNYDQNNANTSNHPPYMPSPYAQPTSVGHTWKPSDEEVLQEVKRNVDLRPPPQPGFVPHLKVQALGYRSAPHRAFRATSNPSEKLDKDYFVHQPSFFKKGVVFRVLWPELAGDVQQNITIATTSRFEDEKFFVKVRWFVVVRELHYSCACLSIQTYQGKGVSAKGKLKHHHSIMHTGTTPPDPLPAELPQYAGEAAMGKPIRVIGRLPYESKMDPMSRVNFLKIYTVEHNVKVKDFGYVAQEDQWILMTQFAAHWHISGPEDGLPAADRSGGTKSQGYAQPPSVTPSGVASPSERPSYQKNASASYMASLMPRIPENTTTGYQEAQHQPPNSSEAEGRSCSDDENNEDQPNPRVFSEYATGSNAGDDTVAPIPESHGTRRRRRSSRSESSGHRSSRSESTGHKSSRSGKKH